MSSIQQIYSNELNPKQLLSLTQPAQKIKLILKIDIKTRLIDITTYQNTIDNVDVCTANTLLRFVFIYVLATLSAAEWHLDLE